jgi:hypothetical protein
MDALQVFYLMSEIENGMGSGNYFSHKPRKRITTKINGTTAEI